MSGDAGNIAIGPGLLHVAPLGTTAPTTTGGVLGSAFRAIGYTEDGNEFSYEPTYEGVKVAERKGDVRTERTDVVQSVTFSMAEATRSNLLLALNQGVVDESDPGYDPEAVVDEPTEGSEVRVLIVHDTEDGARWVFTQCFQNAALTLARRKSPDKTLIPVTFKIETPDTGPAWKCYPTATGLV